jgi:hypothetical protein
MITVLMATDQVFRQTAIPLMIKTSDVRRDKGVRNDF